MKKSFVIIGLFALSSLPLIAYAQGFVPLAPIPNLTQGITADQEGLAHFLNNLYRYLVGFAAMLAVVMIIWGGLEYSTQDVPGAKQNGKNRIYGAILGLVLVLSPVLVFSIINPSILNLSINLDALDTVSGASGASGTNPSGTTDPTTVPGGTILLDTEFIKRGTFSTTAAANAFVAKCSAANLEVQQSCQQDPTGQCLQTTYVLCYKEQEFLRYQLRKSILDFYEDKGVIPRDLSLTSSFAQKCSASSGVLKKESNSWFDTDFTWSIGTGCPADAGFTIDPPYTTARCPDDVWTCKP